MGLLGNLISFPRHHLRIVNKLPTLSTAQMPYLPVSLGARLLSFSYMLQDVPLELYGHLIFVSKPPLEDQKLKRY